MKLTDKEEQEREYLLGLKSSRTIPMRQVDQDRLCYLNYKEFHNQCSNVRCTGYEGTEEEATCPKCGEELFKLL